MITNLKSAKACLSDLVDKASKGEEVWITVRGKPKARICPIHASTAAIDKADWVTSLQEARAAYGKTDQASNVQALWDELRGE